MRSRTTQAAMTIVCSDASIVDTVVVMTAAAEKLLLSVRALSKTNDETAMAPSFDRIRNILLKYAPHGLRHRAAAVPTAQCMTISHCCVRQMFTSFGGGR